MKTLAWISLVVFVVVIIAAAPWLLLIPIIGWSIAGISYLFHKAGVIDVDRP